VPAHGGIYDNMKTAVDAVFARGSGGKERTCNRRFLRMCGHYLVEPVACTPGVGLQGLLALSLSEIGSQASWPVIGEGPGRPGGQCRASGCFRHVCASRAMTS
jgi:hypothetical protein